MPQSWDKQLRAHLVLEGLPETSTWRSSADDGSKEVDQMNRLAILNPSRVGGGLHCLKWWGIRVIK